jgi:hypothetical protein
MMESLSPNWFAEGRMDFEYKKYVLLSYLQKIDSYFHKNILFPQLPDLVFHYNNLLLFKENKSSLQKLFPQRLTKADIEQIKLTYEKIISDDALMHEIENIISYSIPRINSSMQEGKEIYEFVERQINIYPVGLVPLFPYAGYMFIKDGRNKDTKVYEYQITIFENSEEKLRGIHTQFICSYEKKITNTFESIKLELIRSIKKLPNPAVYGIETELTFPVDQTLLPIAKRSLVKYIATN